MKDILEKYEYSDIGIGHLTVAQLRELIVRAVQDGIKRVYEKNNKAQQGIG